jgi:hypothetical protein
MPFVEPTTSRTCAHSFCQDCIVPALQASPHCPIDRSLLSPQDMTPSNPIVRHVRISLHSSRVPSLILSPDGRRAHRRVPQPPKWLRVYVPEAPPCRPHQGRLSLRRGAVPRSGVPQNGTQERHPTQRHPAVPPLPHRLRRLRHRDESRRAWGK